MPFQFKCQCGTELLTVNTDLISYLGKHSTFNITPAVSKFILEMIGEQCPVCGRRLSLVPLSVTVKEKRK